MGDTAGHTLATLHPCGININPLGPATTNSERNVLMDEKENYPGLAHIALDAADADDSAMFVNVTGIAITGRRDFRGVQTIFVRDPDRNVLDLIALGLAAAGNMPGRQFALYKWISACSFNGHTLRRPAWFGGGS